MRSGTRFETFLRALQDGSFLERLLLVNLHDSCAAGLVARADVVAFLSDCVARHKPGATAMETVQVVCASMSAAGTSPRYLRLCRQSKDGLAGHALSHTAKFSTFVGYHVNRRTPPPGARVPALPAPQATVEIARMGRDIAWLTRQAGWHRADATLGSPPPHAANLWLTVDDFADTRRDTREARSEAERMRDELGLVDTPVNEHLVTYTFPAEAIDGIPGVEMARPTFADMGNRRFRVSHGCRRSRLMAKLGWGCTVNLARLPDKKLHPASGRPERVTNSLAIAALRPKVRYLAGVLHERGRSDSDDDAAFLRLALKGRREKCIFQRVARFVAGGDPWRASATNGDAPGLAAR